MEISKVIKFEDLNHTLLIKNGDKGFKELKQMNQEGDWSEYINKMLINKISVRYDFLTDTFTVVPIERRLQENFNYNIDDDYEDQIQVLDINDVKDVFSTLISDREEKIAQEIKSGFDKLKNEIYGNVSTTYSAEQGKSQDSINKIQNDDELNLDEYEYQSAFDNEYVFKAEKQVDEYMHPDIQRIMGNKLQQPKATIEDEVEEYLFDDVTNELEEDQLISKNEVKEFQGKKITLVLTGVMITENEIDYLVDQTNKFNLDLNAIDGQGDKLALDVTNRHNQNKTININKKINIGDESVNPYSVDGISFSNLNEALNFSTKDTFTIETNKKGIIKESTNTKFKTYNQQNWGIFSLGTLNLKTGNNDSIDNILVGSNLVGKNTLLKSRTGDYILIKGTLNERSQSGQRAFLVENRLRKQNDLGEYQVIDTFENTLEGLGDIMLEIKQTSIDLFCFS